MTSRPLLTAALLLLSAPLVYAQDCPKMPWTAGNFVSVKCANLGGTMEGNTGAVITMPPMLTQTPTTFTSDCTGAVTKFVIHSGHQTVTVTCNEPTLSVTESKTP